jgi:hypothetical protein
MVFKVLAMAAFSAAEKLRASYRGPPVLHWVTTQATSTKIVSIVLDVTVGTVTLTV